MDFIGTLQEIARDKKFLVVMKFIFFWIYLGRTHGFHLIQQGTFCFLKSLFIQIWTATDLVN